MAASTSDPDGMWTCSCGFINAAEDTTCWSCGSARDKETAPQQRVSSRALSLRSWSQRAMSLRSSSRREDSFQSPECINCKRPIAFFLPAENGQHWCCNRCMYPIVPIVGVQSDTEFDDLLTAMATPAVATKLETAEKLAKEFLPQRVHQQIEWVCNALRGPTDHLLTMKEVRRWAAVFVWYVAQYNQVPLDFHQLLQKANTDAAGFAEEYEKLVLYQKAALDIMVTSNLALENGTAMVTSSLALENGTAYNSPVNQPNSTTSAVDVSTLYTNGDSSVTNSITGSVENLQNYAALLVEESGMPSIVIKSGGYEMLEEWQSVIETSIDKICKTRIDVQQEVNVVKLAAKEHSKKVFSVDVLENRHFRPSSIAAVCIYFAVRECNLKITQKVVATGCGTSEVTLRKLQKKLIESNTLWSRKKPTKKTSAQEVLV